MRKANLGLIIVTGVVTLMGCTHPSPAAPDVKQNMILTSTTFANNQTIPSRCSATGGNISPELSWTTPPHGTKSLALVMEDPDAPGSSPFTHWVIFNMNPTVEKMSEGKVPPSAVLGKNDNGSNGYYGPNPPSGTHHYHLRLYALDETLPLQTGASKADVVQAMDGHELGMGELIGLYSKS